MMSLVTAVQYQRGLKKDFTLLFYLLHFIPENTQTHSQTHTRTSCLDLHFLAYKIKIHAFLFDLFIS